MKPILIAFLFCLALVSCTPEAAPKPDPSAPSPPQVAVDVGRFLEELKVTPPHQRRAFADARPNEVHAVTTHQGGVLLPEFERLMSESE